MQPNTHSKHHETEGEVSKYCFLCQSIGFDSNEYDLNGVFLITVAITKINWQVVRLILLPIQLHLTVMSGCNNKSQGIPMTVSHWSPYTCLCNSFNIINIYFIPSLLSLLFVFILFIHMIYFNEIN